MFSKLLRAVRANILVGLFLTVPIVVTLLVINFLLGLLTGWFPADRFPYVRDLWNGALLQVIPLLLILAVFYMVGVLVRSFLGRRLYQLGDGVLGRIPFIKTIYIAVRQVSESLFTGRKTLFKEVVLVQYPRKGLYSLAFVTAEVPPSVAAQMEGGDRQRACISLFLPTTPNPTSGLFILVPREDVVKLDMPVADALTFIMSAGAVAPGAQGIHRETLLDKLESWLKHGERGGDGDGDGGGGEIEQVNDNVNE